MITVPLICNVNPAALMITAFFTGVVLAAAVVSQAFQRAFPDFTDRQLQVATFRIRMADSAGDCNIHVFFPALILLLRRRLPSLSRLLSWLFGGRKYPEAVWATGADT